MCIDSTENAFYLARGDARHVFEVFRVSQGQYKLCSGKLLHRIRGTGDRNQEQEEKNVRYEIYFEPGQGTI